MDQPSATHPHFGQTCLFTNFPKILNHELWLKCLGIVVPILFRSCGHETPFSDQKGASKIGDSVLCCRRLASSPFLHARPVEDAVGGMYERDNELEHAPLRLGRAHAVQRDDVRLGLVRAKRGVGDPHVPWRGPNVPVSVTIGRDPIEP
jgi:hypothetical protein